ncbi:NAD(P)/FAD-dependent oxidoreductase [Mesorhizobium calcicola]|uniref:NAD(P)/FAD-dependent oxidoreductase n=1 Tax=Mesorhizobium calcicola TaxID=1300310 RepID=A0ABW4WH97_9HYPH
MIVGAGQAGLSVAEKLRAYGFRGAIMLVGDEPYAPYQRPPLSKAYLLGNLERERLKLKAEDWYEKNTIDVRTGVGVGSIDRQRQCVHLADGATLPYDQLVLATGAVARQLPEAMGGSLAGVFTIRSLTDIDRLSPAIEKGGNLLVVGGGYIGLEIAAVARSIGMVVNVVEVADRLLARVACAETAAEVEALHRLQGVTFHLGKSLDRLLGTDRVTAARLADGTTIEADLVVAGVGALPATGLAEAAGLLVDNGVVVDAFGRTSDPCIWAAGDCANFSLPEGALRMESVGNAIDSGDLVARNIMGAHQPYLPKPWFWSDQFDLKLQIAGISRPKDAVVVRKGEGPGRSHWYYRDGRLVAVDGLNAPRDYLIGKRLLAMSVSPDSAQVADAAIALEIFAKPSA